MHLTLSGPRRRAGRWLAVAALAAGLLGAAAVAEDADAQLGSTATCSLDIQLNLRPGLRLMSSSGSIISSQPGSLNCTGLIDGAPVTGPGTFKVNGDYVGSCAAGSSGGDAEYAIPTSAGTKVGTVDYTVNWAGIAGFISVSDPVYGSGNGPFTFVPVNGNCVTQPLNVIRWTSTQIVLSVP